MEPDRSKRRAEEVFADWLKELDTDREGDLAPLCAAHPELAGELRKLHSDWRKLRPVLDRARVNERLPERLAQRFGADVDPGVSLDEPAGPMPASAASNKLLQSLASRGLTSSRYRLLGEIARGGMGAILKVWDEDLRRHLAMKVVLGKEQGEKSGDTPPNDPRLIARFLEEAQITGQLDHPGIVPVHELGLAGDGRVYFTMRLVKGRDLKQIFELAWNGEEGWSTTRALGVILRACEAMGYAHAKGVVHRDLKPANVMVGRHGEVYVMDWGLARVVGSEDRHDIRLAVEPSSMSEVTTARSTLDDEASDSPLHTLDGDVVGTPTYMSPEQARGAVSEVGPRSDVYAIGAMLYHLLARTPPFVPAGEKISQRVVLMRVLHGPPEPLIALAPETPPELAAICDKAMARNASERYGDVAELAEDLRAFLENRVVRAYRTGAIVELKKWVRRNRGMAAAIAAALVVAIGGLAGVAAVQASANDRIGELSSNLSVKRDELRSMVDDLKDTQAKVNALSSMAEQRATELEALRVSTADEVRRRDELQAQLRKDRDDLARTQADLMAAMQLARMQEQMAQRDLAKADEKSSSNEQRALDQSYIANVIAASASLALNETEEAKMRLAACETSRRGWEWRYLEAASDSSIAVLRGHEGVVFGVAFSADGRLVASASTDHTVRVWDTSTGTCAQVLRDLKAPVGAVDFSADGRWLAAGSDDGVICVWSCSDWQLLRTLRFEREPPFKAEDFATLRALAFSPDCTQLAAGWRTVSTSKMVEIWSVDDSQPPRIVDLDGSWARSVRFDTNGARLLVLREDGEVHVFEVASGARTKRFDSLGDSMYSLALAPQSDVFACGSTDQAARTFGVADGVERAQFVGHADQVLAVAFSPDGATLATGSADRTLRLWNSATGQLQLTLLGHDSNIWSVAFRPDGERIATGGEDGTVRLWDPRNGTARTHLRSPVSSVVFAADGNSLVCASDDMRGFAVRDLVVGDEPAEPAVTPSSTWSGVVDPLGRWVAFGAFDGSVRVFDGKTRAPLTTFDGHTQFIRAMATDDQGALLVTASNDNTLRVWDMHSMALKHVLTAHEAQVNDVVLTADGRRIVSASTDASVRVWDANTGTCTATLSGHVGGVYAVVLDARRGRIISAGADRVLRRWVLDTGRPIDALRADDTAITALAITPDGTRLVSGNDRGVLRLWDLGRSERVLTMLGAQGDVVNSIAFDRDGRRLAVALSYGPTIVFDTTPPLDRSRARSTALEAAQKK